MGIKGTQRGTMIPLKNATEKNASPYALYGIEGDEFKSASENGLAVGVLNPMHEYEERVHPGDGKAEQAICPEDIYGGIQIDGIVDVRAEAGVSVNDYVKVGTETVEDSDGKMVASAGALANLEVGDSPVVLFGIALEASDDSTDGTVISVLVMKQIIPASASTTT